ncbi:MAG: SUMF1/EgtB/PvdO family nonheme iron enzyme [Isosphaeraceae bacterium]
MPEPNEPGQDPRRPPGGYLPRIARFEAPDEEDPVQPRKKKDRKDHHKAKADDSPEAIPAVETFEGRRRIRWIVAGSALAVLGLAIAVLAFSIHRGPSPDDSEGIPPDVGPSSAESNAVAEDAARDLLRRAREAAEANRGDQAVAFLNTIAKGYGRTKSAEEAREALDRQARGLPMFVDGLVVQAESVQPRPAPDPEPPSAVVVVPPVESPPRTADVAVRRPVEVIGRPAPAGSTLARGDVPARTLPPGFLADPGAGVHASGWPIAIVSERDGARMMLVPASAGTIGRDDGPSVERPSRQVKLSAYYLDQHEVTQAQYDRFRGETGRKAPPIDKGADPGSASNPDRPVVMVNFDDALAYAAWAGKALPTEAQWELAGRTPDGRIHPWGPGPAPWESGRPPRQVGPVFSYPGDMSPYGIFDLAGNAWEWTADWYDAKAYGRLPNDAADPAGPNASSSRPPERTIRGGSKDWLATWRTGERPDRRLPYLGFRCALNVEGTPQAAGPGSAPGRTDRPPLVPF